MLAFVHMYKSGGKTLRSILRRNFTYRHCDLYGLYGKRTIPDADWRWLQTCYPDIVSIGGHDIKPYEQHDVLGDVQFYTFVRNPVERALSHYQNLIRVVQNPVPFAEWMKLNANKQTMMLAGEPSFDKAIEILNKKIKFVGITEKFDESLIMWKKWTCLTDLNIHYLAENVAGSSSIKHEVLANPGSLDLLHEYNQVDQAVYDYIAKTSYVQQQKKYGVALDQDVQEFKFELEQQEHHKKICFPEFYARAKRNIIVRPSLQVLTKIR